MTASVNGTEAIGKVARLPGCFGKVMENILCSSVQNNEFVVLTIHSEHSYIS
jgi:hypothetical protein